jgi:NitT/TauT family transport system substrate-binding protein
MERALRRILVILALAASCASAPGETLKLAVGIPGNWDTCIPDVGQRAGIFRRHGLDLDIVYTNGGGETLQATISGGVDIGLAAGTVSVLGAFQKGAPVRIIASGVTGASDLYWYVPAASPIHSIKDTGGKTVAYSTVGGGTHIVLMAMLKQNGIANARPVGTGAGGGTFTQTMSGQIDVGWAAPPFGLEALQDGKIRIIARGSDVPVTARQTVRVHIVNARTLAERHDAVERFVQAYRETYDYLYDDPAGVKVFTQYSPVPEAVAIEIRDTFLPKAAMSPYAVSGIDALTADAIAFKFMREPLSQKQLDELIQIPPPAH